VDPGHVISVSAFAGFEIGDTQVGPKVILTLSTTTLHWSQPDLETAQAYANHLAELVNGADV